MEPSIKGTLFLTVWQEIHDLLDRQAITRGALEMWLEPDDWRFVDDKPVPGFWYPIALHDRLLRVLRKEKGGGSNAYWVEGGRAAADAMASSGLYHQFRAEGDLNRVGPVLVSLSSAAYSFGRWGWRGASQDGRVFDVEALDARALPDSCRYRAVGFIERACELAMQRTYRVTSHRLDPDTVGFSGRLLG